MVVKKKRRFYFLSVGLLQMPIAFGNRQAMVHIAYYCNRKQQAYYSLPIAVGNMQQCILPTTAIGNIVGLLQSVIGKSAYCLLYCNWQQQAYCSLPIAVGNRQQCILPILFQQAILGLLQSAYCNRPTIAYMAVGLLLSCYCNSRPIAVNTGCTIIGMQPVSILFVFSYTDRAQFIRQMRNVKHHRY